MVGSDACLILKSKVSVTNNAISAIIDDTFTYDWLKNQLKNKTVKIEIKVPEIAYGIEVCYYAEIIGVTQFNFIVSVVFPDIGVAQSIATTMATILYYDDANHAWTLNLNVD